MTSDIDDDAIIEQVTQLVRSRYPDVPQSEVDRIVREEFSVLSGRPVRDFLIVLTERAAKQRLKKMGKEPRR